MAIPGRALSDLCGDRSSSLPTMGDRPRPATVRSPAWGPRRRAQPPIRPRGLVRPSTRGWRLSSSALLVVMLFGDPSAARAGLHLAALAGFGLSRATDHTDLPAISIGRKTSMQLTHRRIRFSRRIRFECAAAILCVVCFFHHRIHVILHRRSQPAPRAPTNHRLGADVLSHDYPKPAGEAAIELAHNGSPEPHLACVISACEFVLADERSR